MGLNKKQELALHLAIKWWNDSRERENRPFVISGNAGSGKTYSVRHIIEALDIPEHKVRYVAFTGMASSVLTRRGNPATTIHKLIYNPFMDEKTHTIKFVLKEEITDDIELIILDEVSQVSQKLLDDLMSFQIPIIVLGDNFQLPAIGASSNNLLDKPDVFLDEIMRQALDNPITYLATMIREGKKIQHGTMGDKVFIIPKSKLTSDSYVNVDQIIANKNATVDNVNRYVREDILGLDGVFPYVGEKLMCLKNNWDQFVYEDGIDQYLVNGLLGYVEGLGDYDRKLESFTLDFKPTYLEDEMFRGLNADGRYFIDNLRSDDSYHDDPKYKDMLFRRKTLADTKGIKIDKFTFGYAITTYKSQGSEFNSVLYIDEYMGRITRNSQYVATTRAVDKLIFAL